MTSLQILIAGISFVFSGLAAVIAYSITYEEYQHHHVERRPVRKASVESAVLAFVFFMALGLVTALIWPLLFD